MSPEKEREMFDGFVMQTTQISCTKCSAGDENDCDYLEAIEEFIKMGWRATDRHCYCSKCAKKYLKRQ